MYDDFGRLIVETDRTGSKSYTYDMSGNRIFKSLSGVNTSQWKSAQVKQYLFRGCENVVKIVLSDYFKSVFGDLPDIFL